MPRSYDLLGYALNDKNNFIMDAFDRKTNDYKSLIYGLLAIVLIGMVVSVFQKHTAGNTIKYLALAAGVIASLAVHFYIYKKGGLLPKHGRPTIHSKIILFSIVTAVVFLTVFLAVTYLMFGRN